ncbi:MAG: response regulator [Deltaproteobacteria bacterium]
MKIMIVDDSRAMRMIVMRTLRQAGLGDHTVVEATSGADALRMVKESPPDLILSDWNMPEMTGMELLNAINTDGIRVKLGFVTSESSATMRAQAMEAGAIFFLSKPFTADNFRETVKPWVVGG